MSRRLLAVRRQPRVEICRALVIDGAEVDCIVAVGLVPGGGDNRSEPKYGADVDEVLSVRTDEKDSLPVPQEKWPEGLLEQVRDAALEALAEMDDDREDPPHCDDDFGDDR